jgi:hypothetical protein
MFSLPFLKILVVTGLGWTALAAVTLAVLLVIDWKRGHLW